jgi:dimeric dUTPase (all-alpha-NTP-PPase superfamily)
MRSDLDIDVKLYYDPSIVNISNVIGTAEKYAELLVYISTNAFKKRLGEILEEKIKLSTNINEQLLLDNIISFQDLIKKEIQNASAVNYTPIIRPISVFNPR